MVLLEVVDFILSEVEVLDVGDGLLQTRKNGIRTTKRTFSEEEFEGSVIILHAITEESIGHNELIGVSAES